MFLSNLAHQDLDQVTDNIDDTNDADKTEAVVDTTIQWNLGPWIQASVNACVQVVDGADESEPRNANSDADDRRHALRNDDDRHHPP
jgi:hypothetical protein